MTEYTIKTTLQEADDIASGAKSFIFRGDTSSYGYGDSISFRVYKGKQLTRHALEDMKFRITYVSDAAPIEKGFKVLGIRRIS